MRNRESRDRQKNCAGGPWLLLKVLCNAFITLLCFDYLRHAAHALAESRRKTRRVVATSFRRNAASGIWRCLRFSRTRTRRKKVLWVGPGHAWIINSQSESSIRIKRYILVEPTLKRFRFRALEKGLCSTNARVSNFFFFFFCGNCRISPRS